MRGALFVSLKDFWMKHHSLFADWEGFAWKRNAGIQTAYDGSLKIQNAAVDAMM